MDRYLIAFLLVIFCCAINYFSGVPTEKWQQELEMNLGEKINKVEAGNVQLEEKVNQLENQLENQRLVNDELKKGVTLKETQLEAKNVQRSANKHGHLNTMSDRDVSEDMLHMPAFGRHFSLGTIYDAIKDETIPGHTFWNENALKNVKTERKDKTEFSIIAPDKLTEKFDKLNLSGSLQISILGGKVKLKGPAN